MRFIKLEFIRYLAVGVLNTILTYAIFLAFLQFLSYRYAYTFAYISGIGTSYILQSRLVFQSQLHWEKAIQYPIVYIVQYFLGLIFLSVLVEYLLLVPEFASILNILLTLPIVFLMTRYILKRN